MLSVGAVQAYLGVTGDESYLSILEQGAQELIEKQAGLYLGPLADVTEILDGPRAFYRGLDLRDQPNPTPYVRLSNPLAETETLVVSERQDVSQDWRDVPPIDANTGGDTFELDAASHRLYRRIGDWPEGRRLVRVAYSFGYADDTAPADVTILALDIIAHRYMRPEMRSMPATLQGVSTADLDLHLATNRNENPNGTMLPSELWKRVLALRKSVW